ncbi:DUF3558 family protein [Nocardia sp. NPDC048505]|uniref:DUF3558 family protein n=1 Tax=unclassified Nocardia TaxID=2637762 RepID=UPI0033FA5E33
MKLGVVAAVGVIGLVYGISAYGKSSAPAEVWNPCTGISDDALLAAGLDPATRDSGIPQPRDSGRAICRWAAPRYAYTVTVFSTAEAAIELAHESGSFGWRDVTIAARPGRRFEVAGPSAHRNCHVLFPAHHGVLQISVAIEFGDTDRVSACERLESVGQALVPVLPE